MTGKEFIKIIEDNNLEDFDLEVTFTDWDYPSGYPEERIISIDSMCNIDNSSKKVCFEGGE